MEGIMENLPSPVLGNLSFYQQAGASANNCRIVKKYLKNRYANNWIGANAPVRWHPGSVHLTSYIFIDGDIWKIKFT